jgi:hypothetical protein
MDAGTAMAIGMALAIAINLIRNIKKKWLTTKTTAGYPAVV